MEKGSQKCSQYNLFDSEKFSKNDKNSKRLKKGRLTIKQKQHNNADKAIHQKREDKAFLGLTHWVADERVRKGWKIIYANWNCAENKTTCMGKCTLLNCSKVC